MDQETSGKKRPYKKSAAYAPRTLKPPVPGLLTTQQVQEQLRAHNLPVGWSMLTWFRGGLKATAVKGNGSRTHRYWLQDDVNRYIKLQLAGAKSNRMLTAGDMEAHDNAVRKPTAYGNRVSGTAHSPVKPPPPPAQQELQLHVAQQELQLHVAAPPPPRPYMDNPGRIPPMPRPATDETVKLLALLVEGQLAVIERLDAMLRVWGAK